MLYFAGFARRRRHQGLLDAELIDFEELDTINGLAKTLVFLIWNFCGQNTALVRPSYDAYGAPASHCIAAYQALHGVWWRKAGSSQHTERFAVDPTWTHSGGKASSLPFG